MGRQFGVSTWSIQKDLDWMYQFHTAQSIKGKKNYHIENEKWLRKILTGWGYTDIHVFVEAATNASNSIDFWWKEMTDFDWVLDDHDGKTTMESLKPLTYKRIMPMIRRSKIPYTRKELFVIGKK